MCMLPTNVSDGHAPMLTEIALRAMHCAVMNKYNFFTYHSVCSAVHDNSEQSLVNSQAHSQRLNVCTYMDGQHAAHYHKHGTGPWACPCEVQKHAMGLLGPTCGQACVVLVDIAEYRVPLLAKTPATRLIRPASSATNTEITCFSSPSLRGLGSFTNTSYWVPCRRTSTEYLPETIAAVVLCLLLNHQPQAWQRVLGLLQHQPVQLNLLVSETITKIVVLHDKSYHTLRMWCLLDVSFSKLVLWLADAGLKWHSLTADLWCPTTPIKMIFQ